MADTTTTNVSLTKPEVGASADSWGTKLNANFDTLDSLFTSGPALLVSKGGTGATTASGARTNLGLAIGTDVQAYSSNLAAFSAKTAPTGDVAGTTDAQTFTNKTLTSPTITGATINSSTINGGVITSSSSATASGTSIDITGIPSWVKRIVVQIYAISTNGSSPLLLQIGSGSITSSGYSSQAWATSGSGVRTDGFALTANFQAGFSCTGQAILTKNDSNIWVSTGAIAITSATSNAYTSAGYSPDLGGAIDRVSLTTFNGTDTFDAGSIRVLYD